MNLVAYQKFKKYIKASKEHIFLYTNQRNEEEIVLNPHKLKDVKETTISQEEKK